MHLLVVPLVLYLQNEAIQNRSQFLRRENAFYCNRQPDPRRMFSTDEMREILSDKAWVQKWLDTEAALAAAQAELGVIPKEKADHHQSIR